MLYVEMHTILGKINLENIEKDILGKFSILSTLNIK